LPLVLPQVDELEHVPLEQQYGLAEGQHLPVPQSTG
jgi:hypothetical protein